MNMQLWGNQPHSRFAALDSVSALDALKNSKAAMGLIAEKPKLTKTLDIMKWTKRATALLGTVNELTHPSFELLKNIVKGQHDDDGLFALWAIMDEAVNLLNRDQVFSEKVGETANQAISRWADLELKNV